MNIVNRKAGTKTVPCYQNNSVKAAPGSVEKRNLDLDDKYSIFYCLFLNQLQNFMTSIIKRKRSDDKKE